MKRFPPHLPLSCPLQCHVISPPSTIGVRTTYDRPVLHLLTFMATPAGDITCLRDEIAGFDVKLAENISVEDKRFYQQRIMANTVQITELIKLQQSSSTPGMN